MQATDNKYPNACIVKTCQTLDPSLSTNVAVFFLKIRHLQFSLGQRISATFFPDLLTSVTNGLSIDLKGVVIYKKERKKRKRFYILSLEPICFWHHFFLVAKKEVGTPWYGTTLQSKNEKKKESTKIHDDGWGYDSKKYFYCWSPLY